MFDNQYDGKLKLYRMKVNGLFQRKEKAYHYPHTDWKLNDAGMTALYYVNDSDGPTYLFNEFYKDNPKKLTVYKKIPPRWGEWLYNLPDIMHLHHQLNHQLFVFNIVYQNE